MEVKAEQRVGRGRAGGRQTEGETHIQTGLQANKSEKMLQAEPTVGVAETLG